MMSYLGPNSRNISSAGNLSGLLETCFRCGAFLIENGLDRNDIVSIEHTSFASTECQ